MCCIWIGGELDQQVQLPARFLEFGSGRGDASTFSMQLFEHLGTRVHASMQDRKAAMTRPPSPAA